jgi:hypothetical protein
MGKQNKIPKLLVISSARWGKDSFGEILRDNFGVTFTSSSQAAADIFIYDRLKDKYGYSTPEECFIDRMNRRAEWHELICEYNIDDKAKLAKEILKQSHVYIGMRDKEEIKECIKQGLFDLIVWVDASKRLPEEDSSSFNIDISCADIIIDNNDDYETFKKRAIRLGNTLFN